jgi:peptidoglycan/LPS O-acetylase OafA/YrhL
MPIPTPVLSQLFGDDLPDVLYSKLASTNFANMYIHEEDKRRPASNALVKQSKITQPVDDTATTKEVDHGPSLRAPHFWWIRFPFGSLSAGQIMDRHGGAGPGFDTLRVVLSLTILIYHAKQLVEGRHPDTYPPSLFPLILALVPMFFCLSGFLVTGSALRTRSVRSFLANRSLRIFPALTVEVALSALVLGPLVTNVTLEEYFSQKKFFSYFGNIIGRVRMELPGVFLDNPVHDTVNASLWTLQPEFYCYLLMTALMASTIVYRRSQTTVLYIVLTLVFSVASCLIGFGDPSDVFPGSVIVYYFAAGVIAFHWRMYIPVNLALFLVAAGLSYMMITAPGMMFLASIPISYCTVYLGMLNIPLRFPFNKGDYSYGIYLFNFPIQQAIIYFFPNIHIWWALLFISIPITTLFAAASWRWIEKPTLKLKRHFSRQTPAGKKNNQTENETTS